MKWTSMWGAHQFLRPGPRGSEVTRKPKCCNYAARPLTRQSVIGWPTYPQTQPGPVHPPDPSIKPSHIRPPFFSTISTLPDLDRRRRRIRRRTRSPIPIAGGRIRSPIPGLLLRRTPNRSPIAFPILKWLRFDGFCRV